MNWCNPKFGSYIPSDYEDEQIKKKWRETGIEPDKRFKHVSSSFNTHDLFTNFYLYLFAPSSCDKNYPNEFFDTLGGEKWLEKMNSNSTMVIRDTPFQTDKLNGIVVHDKVNIDPLSVSEFSVTHIGQRVGLFAEDLKVQPRLIATEKTTEFYGRIEVASTKVNLEDPGLLLLKDIMNDDYISEFPITMVFYADGDSLKLEKAINNREIDTRDKCTEKKKKKM